LGEYRRSTLLALSLLPRRLTPKQAGGPIGGQSPRDNNRRLVPPGCSPATGAATCATAVSSVSMVCTSTRSAAVLDSSLMRPWYRTHEPTGLINFKDGTIV
jgi:hypothetical protein